MTIKSFTWFTAVSLVLLLLSAPKAVRGEDLIVEHNPTSGHFDSLQTAYNEAKARRIADPTKTFTIKLKPDDVPYSGLTTPIAINGISIQSESETATTFISGSGTLIPISGVNNITIKNLTFLTASVGISVSGNASVFITNNIFEVGTAGTAVQILQSVASTSIVYNTFYQNGTAISTATDILITNNIFSLNTVAISSGALKLNQVSYNDYNNNGSNGITVTDDPHSLPNTNVPLPADPAFVDSTNAEPKSRDFHLKAGSPCIGASNNGGDLGAYGGSNSDDIPRMVTDVAFATDAPAGFTGVNWSLNQSYQVKGYRVHFGPTISGDGAGSPEFVTQGTNSTTISDTVLGTPATPAAPILTSLTAKNQALAVTWQAADSNATSYRVFYSISPAMVDPTSSPSQVAIGGSTTSHVLTGLENGVTYNVAVQAINDNQLFITVTAVNTTGTESVRSNALIKNLGEPLKSAISNSLSDFPEATAPYPNLKGEGCFIATAAYGFYSAPQVQALRDFRDRYLLTNAPGRAFVAWYYRYGPRGAHFINLHPWLKPPVRLALLPLVAGSLFLTGSSAPVKLAVAALALVLVAMLLRRNRQPAATPGWRHWKKFTLTLLLIILPALAQGAETRSDRPHWSLELKGGAFFPEVSNWSKFYGSSYIWEYGGAIAYKVHRQLEVGIEGTYSSTTGKGQLPQHLLQGSAVPGGEVTNQLVPLNVFVLARGIFTESQLLVPYAAAGYTRMFYRQKVEGQGTTQGSVNGFHARGGVQLLLDGLEADASRSLYADYGIHHTYLFAEAKYVRAMADTVSGGSVNLGGTSCLGGFLFEF